MCSLRTLGDTGEANGTKDDELGNEGGCPDFVKKAMGGDGRAMITILQEDGQEWACDTVVKGGKLSQWKALKEIDAS